MMMDHSVTARQKINLIAAEILMILMRLQNVTVNPVSPWVNTRLANTSACPLTLISTTNFVWLMKHAVIMELASRSVVTVVAVQPTRVKMHV